METRRLTHGLFVLAACAGFLFACSPAPAPVASSLRDPSNPNAPEGRSAHRMEIASERAVAEKDGGP